MQRKRLAILIILVAVSSIGAYWFKKSQNKHSANLTPVTITKAKTMSVPQIVTATGNLFANQSTFISPKINGYVTKILFHEGQWVAAGTPLVELDNREEIDVLAAAKSKVEVSKLQYQRNKKFLEKGFITQDVYYNSKVIYEENTTNLTIAANKLADKTITAPFSGIVGAHTISVGDYVTAGSKLTSLVDINQLRVDYALPFRFQSNIHVGQSITISTDALPQRKFLGKVTYIAAMVDLSSQTINLRATLDNLQNLLKPGQFVTLSQHLGNDKKILTVPPQSLAANLNGYYVYTVKDGLAAKTRVTVGEKFADQVEIISGLTTSDDIVVAGQNRLTDKMPVEIYQPEKIAT